MSLNPLDRNTDKLKKIYVAGHMGMVGSAIVRELEGLSDVQIISRTHAELDLTQQIAVREFLQSEKPDQVFLAAAKVGGIQANNKYPADFIYLNLMIQTNVIHESFNAGVKKLLFIGSSCIYPKITSQPIMENALLTGPLEETNEPYAIAKIAGIKLCESYNRQYGLSSGIDYRSIMPTNLYGYNDNYHAENSHVIPALIRRFHESKISGAKSILVWGSGKPRREFLFADDLARASILIMNLDAKYYTAISSPMLSHINVGKGHDLTIAELSHLVAEVVGFKGHIEFDTNKPDGTFQKLLDNSRIKKLGWSAEVELKEGLIAVYNDFLAHHVQRA